MNPWLCCLLFPSSKKALFRKHVVVSASQNIHTFTLCCAKIRRRRRHGVCGIMEGIKSSSKLVVLGVLYSTLVAELPNKLPTEMMVFFLSKTLIPVPCPSLSLLSNSWRLIKTTSTSFHAVSTSTENDNRLFHVSFPLALVLQILVRKIHNQMHATYLGTSLTFSRCMCC